MKAWKEEENFVEKSLVTTTTDPERWAPFGGRPVAVAAAVPRRPLLSMPPPLPLLPPPSPPPPPPPPAPEDEEDAVYMYGNGENIYDEDGYGGDDNVEEIRIVRVPSQRLRKRNDHGEQDSRIKEKKCINAAKRKRSSDVGRVL